MDDEAFPYVGQFFATFADFKESLNQLEQKTGHIYTVCRSISVAAANKQLKTDRAVRFKESWQYKQATVGCKQYGSRPSESTGVRAVQHSFKTKCPAHIQLYADRKKDGLTITACCTTHNHEPALDAYPEHRRLNASQKDEVKKYLQLGVSSIKVREHVQQQHGKYVTARDVQNLRAAMKDRGLADADDLWSEVQRCSTELGSSVIAVPDDNGELMVLFWQSEFMKKIYNCYPTMIFMDGTYKVNNRSMPLYSLLVVDGEGNGQVVAYAIVRDESARSLSTVLQIFKDSNPTADPELSVVLVDKDYAEINAFESVFGNAHIILCKMHVLDAFRRSFKGHNLTIDERDVLRDLLQSMVHTKTEAAYVSARDQIASVSDTYAQYFMQNWEPIKHMWAGYLIKTLPHFGFTTNNSVESHNSKIKRVLNHHSKLADVLRQLFLLENTKIQERNIAVRRMLCTRVRVVGPHCDDRSVKDTVYTVATRHAAQLVMAQLDKSRKDSTVTQGINGDGWAVKIENGQEHMVTAFRECDCSHFSTTGLPCAHIFVARAHSVQPKFVDDMIPQRWTRKQYVQSLHEMSATQMGSIVTCEPVQSQRPKSAQEKFREASCTTDALANLLASVGQTEYDTKLRKLKFLLDIWKNGDDVSMEQISLSVDWEDEGSAADDDPAQHNLRNNGVEPVLEPNLSADVPVDWEDEGSAADEDPAEHNLGNNGVDPVLEPNLSADMPVQTGSNADTCTTQVVVHEIPSTVPEDEQPRQVLGSSNAIHNITLPKGMKIRGRPKGVGQTVIGAKRKKVKTNIDECAETEETQATQILSSSGTVSHSALPKTCGRPIRTKRKKAVGNENSKVNGKKSRLLNNDILDSICYCCNSDEPPSALNVNHVIEWADCEKNCGRWFHKACINTTPYICAFCM